MPHAPPILRASRDPSRVSKRVSFAADVTLSPPVRRVPSHYRHRHGGRPPPDRAHRHCRKARHDAPDVDNDPALARSRSQYAPARAYEHDGLTRQRSAYEQPPPPLLPQQEVYAPRSGGEQVGGEKLARRRSRVEAEDGRLVRQRSRVNENDGRLVRQRSRMADGDGKLVRQRSRINENRSDGRLVRQRSHFNENDDRLVRQRSRVNDSDGQLVRQRSRMHESDGRLVRQRSRANESDSRLSRQRSRTTDSDGKLSRQRSGRRESARASPNALLRQASGSTTAPRGGSAHKAVTARHLLRHCTRDGDATKHTRRAVGSQLQLRRDGLSSSVLKGVDARLLHELFVVTRGRGKVDATRDARLRKCLVRQGGEGAGVAERRRLVRWVARETGGDVEALMKLGNALDGVVLRAAAARMRRLAKG